MSVFKDIGRWCHKVLLRVSNKPSKWQSDDDAKLFSPRTRGGWSQSKFLKYQQQANQLTYGKDFSTYTELLSITGMDLFHQETTLQVFSREADNAVKIVLSSRRHENLYSDDAPGPMDFAGQKTICNKQFIDIKGDVITSEYRQDGTYPSDAASPYAYSDVTVYDHASLKQDRWFDGFHEQKIKVFRHELLSHREREEHYEPYQDFIKRAFDNNLSDWRVHAFVDVVKQLSPKDKFSFARWAKS